MFSATFPRQMESLARKILDKPVEVVNEKGFTYLYQTNYQKTSENSQSFQ